MPTTPRPAYIWDANSNDWAPLAGTVDTGQSYNFSAVQNFNAGLVSPTINGGGVTGQNHLINGGMDVWQRGTSFAAGGPGAVFYSADRWTCYAGNTGTISKDTSFMPVGFESSLKFTSTINNSGIDFYQLIETKNVIPLQGKVVTLSAYVAGTNGKTAPGMTAYYSNTNDDMIYLTSGVVLQTVAVSSPLSSTSFQRISMTFTVPSTAKTIRIGLISNILNNTEFINWAGVKLEVGSVATPFSRVGGSFVSELASCQRYFYTLPYNYNAERGNPYTDFLIMNTADQTSWARGVVQFPVTMRTSPTLQTPTAANYYILGSAGVLSITSIAIDNMTNASMAVVNAYRTGLSTGTTYFLRFAGNVTDYLRFSAEL
jgi:hypothetical protein